MLKKLKIRGRLVLSFSTMVLLTLIITAASLVGLRASGDNLNDFIDHSYTADTAIKMCRIEANVAARTVREMTLDANPANMSGYKAKIDENITALKADIEVLKNSYPEQDGLVDQYEKNVNDWINEATNIVAQLEKGENAVAANLILTKCSPALQTLVDTAKQLDGKLEILQNETLATSQSIIDNVSLAVFVLLIVSVLMCIVLAIKVT
ncbi:MAG: MCP four helix bundle domain-containing protein, partial [Oscillospiraceae bacterium]